MAQQPWLSFNESFGGKGSFGIAEDDEEMKEALKQPMKLKDTWVLWEQVVQDSGKAGAYGDATKEVTKFNTVQEFWSIWNGMPQPSELLANNTGMRIMRHQVAIDAIMIFKEGVKPEWEDKQNASGGHFQIQLKPSVGGGQIDEYWNNLVLGMVGGTLEPSDMITGLRLVDKLAGPKSVNAIRIELWFTKYADQKAVNTLKSNMEKCLGTRLDNSVQALQTKPDVKPHSTNIKH